MSKTFVVGDIHGAYHALCQCLERSKFDYEKDNLISLGDVSDGWPDTKQCIDELMKIENLIYILGNHDLWTLDWMKYGVKESIWLRQGGEATVRSYHDGIPSSHMAFLENALPYYLLDNNLFVHAGIDPQRPLEEQDLDILLWDRNLARKILDCYLKNTSRKLTRYNELYVGHTPVPFTKPIKACEVWMMDTGAGWSGVLSMLNIETKEVFTSDPVPLLYPGVKGRTRH